MNAKAERRIFNHRAYLLAVAMVMVGLVLFTSAKVNAAGVTVFAAASLSDALKEIGSQYERDSGDKISFNFAASSFLARHIEEGAPAHIFFSADEAKMNDLERKGLIVKGTRAARLANSLVIVVAREEGVDIKTPDDLAFPKVRRIALAEPRTVPAGIYAKAYLESKKLWPTVKAKVVPTENVRAAMAAVEAGNAEAAIIYKTDAAISTKVKVAFEVPETEGPAIRYPMTLVKGAESNLAADRLLKHLASDAAGRVFEKFGFRVLR